MPLKRGITTSEFWGTVATIATMFGSAFDVLSKSSFTQQYPDLSSLLVIGVSLASAVAMGAYSISRGIAKKGVTLDSTTTNAVG